MRSIGARIHFLTSLHDYAHATDASGLKRLWLLWYRRRIRRFYKQLTADVILDTCATSSSESSSAPPPDEA